MTCAGMPLQLFSHEMVNNARQFSPHNKQPSAHPGRLRRPHLHCCGPRRCLWCLSFQSEHAPWPWLPRQLLDRDKPVQPSESSMKAWIAAAGRNLGPAAQTIIICILSRLQSTVQGTNTVATSTLQPSRSLLAILLTQGQTFEAEMRPIFHLKQGCRPCGYVPGQALTGFNEASPAL